VRGLSDAALDRLRLAADEPDLSETPYTLCQRLARGGMGTVYLAHDTRLHREVALKVLSLPDPDGRATARMAREARVLARLEHPGIVPIHDTGTLPDGRPFYVMKLVRGERLDALLGEETPRMEKLRIFERLCEAVAFAHDRGVVHRDLKTENIMVGAFGEVLVMDWGVAKVLDRGGEDPTGVTTAAPESGPPPDAGDAVGKVAGTRHKVAGTRHGTVLGTPGFMAPEQARGEVAAIGPLADVYALGAILRALLGEGPLPRPLRAVCDKALAEAPEARYDGAGALAEEIRRYRAQLPVAAHREAPWEKALRLMVKYRVPILIILAYLLMRILLVVTTGR
jgi:serine/threonine protein kinase